MVLSVSQDVLSGRVCVGIYHNRKAKAPVCSRSSFVAPEQVKGVVCSHLLTEILLLSTKKSSVSSKTILCSRF